MGGNIQIGRIGHPAIFADRDRCLPRTDRRLQFNSSYSGEPESESSVTSETFRYCCFVCLFVGWSCLVEGTLTCHLALSAERVETDGWPASG